MFLVGCATDKRLDRATRAAGEAATAGTTVRVIEATREAAKAPLPPLPGDCTGQERSGVSAEDGADVALVKSDKAIGRANDRVRRCAEFYRKVKEARE